jgi:hypothetical protein
MFDTRIVVLLVTVKFKLYPLCVRACVCVGGV